MGTAICQKCGLPFEHEQVRPRFCSECKRLKANAAALKWHRNNPERAREIRRGWVERNPEAMAAARKAWREANRDRWPGYRRASKKRNPEANRSDVRRRKARKRGASTVPFTREQLRQRLAYFGGLCWMCHGPADQIDHVKPLAAGGGHLLCNLRPACGECNARKRDPVAVHAVVTAPTVEAMTDQPHTRVTICITAQERDALVADLRTAATILSSGMRRDRLCWWADRIAVARVAQFPAGKRRR